MLVGVPMAVREMIPVDGDGIASMENKRAVLAVPAGGGGKGAFRRLKYRPRTSENKEVERSFELHDSTHCQPTTRSS